MIKLANISSMYRILIILLIGLIAFSCGGPKKLKPSETAKETRKLFRKKKRAYLKEHRQKKRSKKRKKYYNKDNAYHFW